MNSAENTYSAIFKHFNSDKKMFTVALSFYPTDLIGTI